MKNTDQTEKKWVNNVGPLKLLATVASQLLCPALRKINWITLDKTVKALITSHASPTEGLILNTVLSFL